MKNTITAQQGASVTNDDRLALATLLVKMGYAVRLVTVRDKNGKSQKAVEYETKGAEQ